jgi:glutathione S-transferase
MPNLILCIGNKNLSSWSMRPWLALEQSQIPFEEVVIRLNREDTRAAILGHSPTGKVPSLKHGELLIWDSLAIVEYLAETFPSARLWPQPPEARAFARSVCCEMHSGFAALRNELPMNTTSKKPCPDLSEVARGDIARIEAIWKECRDRFGAAGPMLFGHFTIADAFFAPVVLRLENSSVSVGEPTRIYMKSVLELGSVKKWIAGARAEVGQA